MRGIPSRWRGHCARQETSRQTCSRTSPWACVDMLTQAFASCSSGAVAQNRSLSAKENGYVGAKERDQQLPKGVRVGDYFRKRDPFAPLQFLKRLPKTERASTRCPLVGGQRVGGEAGYTIPRSFPAEETRRRGGYRPARVDVCVFRYSCCQCCRPRHPSPAFLPPPVHGRTLLDVDEHKRVAVEACWRLMPPLCVQARVSRAGLTHSSKH